LSLRRGDYPFDIRDRLLDDEGYVDEDAVERYQRELLRRVWRNASGTITVGWATTRVFFKCLSATC